MSANDFARLQRVQNTLARVILHKRKFDHITPSLMELHWLPILQRVHFKVAILTYKTIHTKERTTYSILSGFMNLSVHYARPVVAYLVGTELVLL